jgi:hypothetical protein
LPVAPFPKGRDHDTGHIVNTGIPGCRPSS